MAFQHLQPDTTSELLHSVPGYRIVRCLGQGGYAVTYLAHNLLLDRSEVVKVLRSDASALPGSTRSMLHEVRALARLSHPNIATTFGIIQTQDGPAIALEFVDGDDLDVLVGRNGPFPVALACECILQAALGLQHSHENGIIHADVKPSNLLLGQDGGVKVVDFGLARFAETSHESSCESLAGTPDFLAPERIDEHRSPNELSDIYSLGCTFYFLLTGRVPFPGASERDTLVAHLLADARPVTLDRKDIPDGLTKVLARMMARSPDARYQHFAEVIRSLEPFTGNDSIQVTRTPARSVRMALIGLGVMVAVGVLMIELILGSPAFPHESAVEPEPSPNKAASGHAWKIETYHWRAQTRTRRVRVVDIGGGQKLELVRIDGHVNSETTNRPFSLGKTEVTIGQYGEFVEATGYQTYAELKEIGYGFEMEPVVKESVAPKFSWRHAGYPATDDCPAGNLCWHDAKRFCEWASTRTGLPLRLPTEAEWEYACRGQTVTPYFTGEDVASLEGYANFVDKSLASIFPSSSRCDYDDGHAFASPVGSYNPNPFGLYDMVGNFWEWTETIPETAGQQTLRGGSFLSPPEKGRTTFRAPNNPYQCYNHSGFRIACTEADPTTP